MLRQRPDDRRAPVTPDEDGGAELEIIEQLQHVADDFVERVGGRLDRHARASIATHIGRDGPESQAPEDGS
jgi:hypothetical protein